MIIRAKLDVTRIDKSAIFIGTKGKYIDITLLENRDGTDQYDNDFMVIQDIGKQRRETGEKGPILGNAKYIGQKPAQASPPREGPQSTRPAQSIQENLDEDVPF